jgi:predicted nucleic acid-binding Zn ribbon protein
MKHCQFCDKNFQTDISYQIYCSSDCRELATKEKIATRYLMSRRQKRIGKNRLCKSCSQDLSIYNDDNLCSNCSVNPSDVTRALKIIKDNLK